MPLSSPPATDDAPIPEGRAFTAHLHVHVDVGAILAAVLLPPTLVILATLATGVP